MNTLEEKLRVLIVDDHQMTRKMVQDLLLLLGFKSKHIEQADDGDAAYKKLSGKPDEIQFNIVILDWHMPKMKGIDLLKKCRSEKKFDNVAFMMLTAEADKANVIDSVRSGANSYIHKPFTEKQFEEKLRKVMDSIPR